MKQKEGITLIALILTIIIMLILLGATIGTISTNFIGKTKDVSIQKSLEMVDTAIKLYKTEKKIFWNMNFSAKLLDFTGISEYNWNDIL